MQGVKSVLLNSFLFLAAQCLPIATKSNLLIAVPSTLRFQPEN